MTQRLIQELSVTAELFNQTMSPGRLKMTVSDLAAYGEDDVANALARCRKECKFMPTIADIIERMPNQHPAVDEAWSIAPKEEDSTAVVTDEIMEAWGCALALWDDGEKTAARMAFKAAYERAVSSAMAESKRPKWWVSMGSDSRGRVGPIFDAVTKGRISPTRAADLLPPSMRDEILTLPTPNRPGSHKMLGGS